MSNIDKRSLRLHQHSALNAHVGGRSPSEPRPSVQVACAPEISKWCESNEELALDLRRANADRAELNAALLAMNQCLASRTSVLSSECLSSLVVSYMEAPRGTGTYIHGRDRERNKVHRGHLDGPRRPLSDSDDTWEPKKQDNQPRGGPVDNKQDYYWNKHGFGRAGDGGDGRQIRSGDSGRLHVHHRHDNGFDHSAVAWLVILPFFALGVFVAVRRALAFYRQRQLAITHHSVDARDYEPLNPRQSDRDHRDGDD